MIRIFLIAVLALALSSCGFQLRGTGVQALEVESVNVVGSEPELMDELGIIHLANRYPDQVSAQPQVVAIIETSSTLEYRYPRQMSIRRGVSAGTHIHACV